MAAETRFEGDPKQEQKEDADLQQVVSWLLHNNVPIALPTSGSYWLQTLWLQKNHLLLKEPDLIHSSPNCAYRHSKQHCYLRNFEVQHQHVF